LKRLFGLWALMVLLWSGAAHAQEQCSAIMEQAIELVSAACSATGRNEACHGYFRVEAKPRDEDMPIPFNVGDIISVLDFSALTTAPMNLDEGEWGVALLRLQANLPDVLPGQNVTFLLLGDTRIQADDTAENARPMQIFQLETGITGVRCSEGPADGLLVQTPQDIQQIKLTVNGVTIEAAGTAFVQAQPNKTMTVSALDGTITVSLGDQRQTLESGTQIEIPMDGSLVPRGVMSEPIAVQLSSVVGLPIALLPRAVEAPVLEASQVTPAAGATPITLGATQDVRGAISMPTSQMPTLVSTPVPLEPTAALQAEDAPFDLRSVLLTVSVVILVSLLVLLLVLIIAIVVRTLVRQIRRKQDLE
jgi:hypothetical protein